MDSLTARQLVAEAGKRLLAEGLTARTWGNISCRIDEDLMAITPSGLAYDGMMAEDIVIMNVKTGEWEGNHKPSSEKRIHSAAYQQFPDAGFVLHTHQIYASALGLAGYDDLLVSEEELDQLGRLSLSDYALPSTKELFHNVSHEFESGAQVVLMENHGAVIVGKDAHQAFERTILLEEICRKNTKGLSNCSSVSNEEEVNVLLANVKKEFAHVKVAEAPAILACAGKEKSVRAQLDDMAQMIGTRLLRVPAEEKKIIKVLQSKNVILVPGIGAFCRADSEEDVNALCMLVEKACVAWLHTEALRVNKTLPIFESWLMRAVYLTKYSKKIGG